MWVDLSFNPLIKLFHERWLHQEYCPGPGGVEPGTGWGEPVEPGTGCGNVEPWSRKNCVKHDGI